MLIFLALLCADAAHAQWIALRLHPPEASTSQVFAVGADGSAAGEVTVPGLGNQPALWGEIGQGWISLAPPGTGGRINVIAEGRQAGEWQGRASIWSGTAASRVDLHPSGATTSSIFAELNNQQAGEAWFAGNPHAALWSGSAGSFVDLQPAGAARSFARATDGIQQGGQVEPSNPNQPDYAALWTGTAQSVVNLNGSHRGSDIRGMVPGQQVGYAFPQTGSEHAALWRGTPESFVDLNPAGAGLSELRATCGSAQAGYANLVGLGVTAGIWFGTPESFVPLAPYLPPGYFQSTATSVALVNGEYYVGGYARSIATHQDEAFLWIGVPAPGAAANLFASFALAAARRRRRSQLI